MGQRHGGARRWVPAAALVALQVVVLVTLVARGVDADPHQAPVGVVAPPVVSTALTEMVETLPDQPLAPKALTSSAAARTSVADGSIVAAVVVDLRREQDVLYLASARGTDLNRAVKRLVGDVEAGYGREVVVRDVVPTVPGDDDAWGVYLLAGGCMLLGFVAPVLITWRRGPVAATVRLGLVRLAIVAVAAAAAGLVVAVVAAARYDTGLATWWLIATLALTASATVTMALESLFGVLGIGVATTLLVLTSAPLLLRTSPVLLSEPWATMSPWLPHGAALEASLGHAYFGGSGVRPLAILAAWVVLSVLTLGVARRERARDDVAASAVRAGVERG